MSQDLFAFVHQRPQNRAHSAMHPLFCAADEGQWLAPFAVCAQTSRGRVHPEHDDQTRNPYARDRDRIIHSAAFRRLEYKTQVFVNHEGDLYRTRLTHSIEVAQVARAVARRLRLNEDVTEAIALAHDLGHTPFGHAGQDALNAMMRQYGGFEHNLQSLRIVDQLEERYGAFHGLNLTYETREGILKHCSARNAQTLGELGLRFIHKRQPSLEAQLTNVADAIAYSNHDIDDGLRCGILRVEGLRSIALFAHAHDAVLHEFPEWTRHTSDHRMALETVRRMIHAMVEDLYNASAQRIVDAGVMNIDEVRNSPPLIGFSPPMQAQMTALKAYLREHMYHHHRVMHMTRKARMVIHALFNAYLEEPRLMPRHYQIDKLPPNHPHTDSDSPAVDPVVMAQTRKIADYIAGMTDRYCLAQYRKLFDANEPTPIATT